MLLLPWFAMLACPSVRGRMIVAILLTIGLVAASAAWLLPRHRAALVLLSTARPALMPPPDLPASPLAETSSTATALPPIIGLAAAQRNALSPFAALGSAARPFHFAGSPQDRTRAQTCLAAAMLYEAGGDAAGQLAVGQVVLNRVRHPAFPGSICGVVTQGSERSTGCQFTFTCEGALARRVSNAAVAAARARADAMLDGLVFAGVGLATHYHTDQVFPWWSPKLEKIARVGPHLFFRWPGVWGSPRAMLGKRLTGEPSAGLFASFLSPMSAPDTTALSKDVAMTTPARTALTNAADLRPRDAASNPGEGAPVSIPSSRRLTFRPAAPVAAVQLSAMPMLQGHRLLGVDPASGTYFLQLAPGWSEAEMRRTAVALCGGKVPCHVYGWRDAQDAPTGGDLTKTAEASIAFRFDKVAARKAPHNAPVAQIF